MKTRKSKAEKAVDKLIESTYYKYGSGVQIMIMDIPKIFREARVEMLTGKPIEEVIQNLIAKYRQN